MDRRVFNMDIDCGEDYLEGFGHCFMAADMIFDRLDKGRGEEFCVFSENRKTTGGEAQWASDEEKAAYARSKYGTWSERITTYTGSEHDGTAAEGGRFSLPPWIIRMRVGATGGKLLEHDVDGADEGLDDEQLDELERNEANAIVNDTELPELIVDHEAHELSFNWVQMFSRLLAEAAQIARLDELIASNDENNARIESLRTKQLSAESLFEAVRKHLGHIAQQSVNNRRTVRRERIKTFYRERFNWTYKDHMFDGPEERECLKKLTENRFGSGNFLDQVVSGEAGYESDSEDLDT
jgi:hypothetical protein